MLISFFILIVICLIFFVLKTVYDFLMSKNNKMFYNNYNSIVLKDASLVVYLIAVFCFCQTLNLLGIYGKEEVFLTLIVLAIIALLCIVEKVLKHAKNREYFFVASNILQLKFVAEHSENGCIFENVLDSFAVKKQNIGVLENLNFDENEKGFFKNKQNFFASKTFVFDLLSLLFCLAILIVGVVSRV